MKKITLGLLAFMAFGGLYASEPRLEPVPLEPVPYDDSVIDILLINSPVRVLLDKPVYEKIYSMVKRDIRLLWMDQRYKTLSGVSYDGFWGIVCYAIKLVDGKDSDDALEYAFEKCVKKNKGASFCEMLRAAQEMEITGIVPAAQAWLQKSFQRLIDLQDQSFAVQVINLKKNEMPDLYDLETTVNGTPLITYAVQNGKHDIVEALVGAGVSVNTRDEYGMTPLMYAAQQGAQDLVKMLVGAHADVKSTDNGKMSALLYAASKGHKNTAEYLIAHDADVEQRDKYGRSALDYAACYDHDELLAYLGGEDAQNDTHFKRRVKANMQLRKWDPSVEPIKAFGTSSSRNMPSDRSPSDVEPPLAGKQASWVSSRGIGFGLAVVVLGWLVYESRKEHARGKKGHAASAAA